MKFLRKNNYSKRYSSIVTTANNRKELKATSGGTLDFKNSYTYDTLQRLTDIIQQGQSGGNSVTSKHVTIGYNALGQETSIARYQSTGTTAPVATSAFTYDTLNRIDTLTHKQSSTTLDSYDYDFDGMSRVTKVTNGIDGVANYTYDKSSQLTAADNPSPLADEAYSYDANGNRTSTGYTINTNNQTSASPGYTYTYDDEGNRTKRTETATGHVEEYSYDYRNRLTAVKFRNTAAGAVVKEVDYAYDYQNRMIKRAYDADGAGAGAPTYQYWVYDDSINAVLQFDGAAASNLSHRYLWANGVDALLADEQVTSLGSGGNPLWALSDNQGSVRDIADLNESTGVTTVTNHRTYNSFGKLTSETNAAVDLVFGYTGKYLDDATGYQNNVNRWYDSNLGQWLSEDPLALNGGDPNLKRYVNNSPLMLADMFGLQGEESSQGSTPQGAGSHEGDLESLLNKRDEINGSRALRELEESLLRQEMSTEQGVVEDLKSSKQAASWRNLWNLFDNTDAAIAHSQSLYDKAEKEAEQKKDEAEKLKEESQKVQGEIDSLLREKAWLDQQIIPGPCLGPR